ncbi:hypothetical protein AO398_08525 [Methylobacterium sp. GXS13]|uniref:tyrosine-type recombinase/integrase n=1 Tax=Methylobacterium sp. GXS13 TaxID=1730094 RepID=UPI00071BBDAB|nr:tyrosine-type recombinase/integrase [Methylobacterium sp. GXS13]KST57478.1 hypothetical protein AO398_08525 [Methylobacterium sp. GXS13]
MTIIRIKGFQIFRDRHGKMRCYHRKSREAIDLTVAPLGSSEFFAECSRISSVQMNLTAKPGSLGRLIQLYREHEAFLDLAEQTKFDYQKVFNYLKGIADVALVKFDRPLVVRIRDRAASSKGRRFGNYVKAVLSIVFGWGSERGYIRENVASGIKDIRRKKSAPRANRPWSDAEREAVLEAAPAHMRSAFALMMFTGLGPKDALTLPRTFYRHGEIATRRSKTNQPVFWPAPMPLAEILAKAPDHSAMTLCATSTGTRWTLSGFRASWRPVRVKLEQAGRVQPGLTLYGLRHTVAVILREIGFDERTIADALGQRTIEMARHYADGADLRQKMAPVVAAFDSELNKRSTRVVKPGG